VKGGKILEKKNLKVINRKDEVKDQKEVNPQGDLVIPPVADDSSTKIIEKGRTIKNLPFATEKVDTTKIGKPIVSGILLKDLNPKKKFKIFFGKYYIDTFPSVFRNEYNVFYANQFNCEGQKITFRIVGNRLYCSLSFKDLEKEKIVGTMVYNHWELYDKNYLDYQEAPDHTGLRVSDSANNTIFSIYSSYSSFAGLEVYLRGYFISNSTILVCHDEAPNYHTCISKDLPNWKQLARREFDKIDAPYLTNVRVFDSTMTDEQFQKLLKEQRDRHKR
jgi:hypothetical protein